MLKKFVAFIGWILLGVFVLSFFLISLSVFHALSSDEKSEMESAKTGRAVGVVELKGQILSADAFAKSLKEMVENKYVKAIVVQIDTPGGAVGASEEIHALIREADLKKPVVASLGNMAASGGLYAAVAARKIVSYRGTLTGSIGVIFFSPNVASLTEKVGVEMMVVKSGPFKDSGSPFRPQTAEDRQILQRVVDQTYGQFVRAVADGRKLSEEQVRRFADGRVIAGEEAKELGLVDELGSFQRAAKLSLELAGIEGEPEIIHARKTQDFFEMLQGVEEKITGSFSESLMGPNLRFQFMP